MNSAKHVLERISGISAFVVGILLTVLFLPSLLIYLNQSLYFVVELLLVIALNAPLITIGAIVGFDKTQPPMFGKMFNIFAISVCGALFFLSPIMMIMYAVPCITGLISLFLKREAKRVANDKTDPIILDLIAKNENRSYRKETIVRKVNHPSVVFDIENEILKLKELKDKEIIDEEQYKESVDNLINRL